MKKEDLKGLAHEIWAAAQVLPDEGIEHAVDRISRILSENFGENDVDSSN